MSVRTKKNTCGCESLRDRGIHVSAGKGRGEILLGDEQASKQQAGLLMLLISLLNKDGRELQVRFQEEPNYKKILETEAINTADGKHHGHMHVWAPKRKKKARNISSSNKPTGTSKQALMEKSSSTTAVVVAIGWRWKEAAYWSGLVWLAADRSALAIIVLTFSFVFAGD
ncbi:unnamed protein product [Linum trigynum]|uniref:Uncharacterized protein n=1 Tax=Linum trigynum TaxID=586398 RepID=A0AAV2FFQ5_9ROSI